MILKRIPATGLGLSLKSGTSLAGGGALPMQEIATVLLSLRPGHSSASALEVKLRSLDVPIIARIADEEVLFDLRTIEEGELAAIKEGIKTILASS